MRRPLVYLTGSLRDANVPAVANALRDMGFDMFDDWFAAGQKADEEWQAYEQKRGHTYLDALAGNAANHVFTYDLYHLQRADAVVCVMPAGKSSFLELGWAIGQGKKGYVYIPFEPERWDVMVKFARGVHQSIEGLAMQLRADFGIVIGEPGDVIRYNPPIFPDEMD